MKVYKVDQKTAENDILAFVNKLKQKAIIE
jgi:hypothetical protein